MDTYPCPNCGGVADEEAGCHRCGRAHDAGAARLHKLRQAMASLADESRRLDADRSDLTRRRGDLLREREQLTIAIAQRLADERAGRPTPVTTPTRVVPGRPPQQPAAPGPAPVQRRVPPTRTVPLPRTPPAPVVPSGHPAETSQRSAQNAQLTLGGVLLAIAAIVVAGVYYTTTASGGRAAVLAVATTIFLGVPVLLTRNTLVATAETIASIGLLLVLLDGFTAYRANLAGVGAVPRPLYAAVLFALVTGVAAAYRLATHLRAPQFVTLLAVQPLLPLVAWNFHFGQTGFAIVFAVVAAFNLGAIVVLGLQLRILAAGRLRRRHRQSTVDGSVSLGWPRMLRELAWLLYGLTLTTSVVLASDVLQRATSARQAAPAALAVVVAALTGVAAGQIQTIDRLRVIAGGAATLAIIAAVSRVDYLALRDYTLVLTAALAAAIALAAQALPARVRPGPQLGALVAAALAGVFVVADLVRTTVGVVRAATEPRVWSADLGHVVVTTTWQVPLAAVLLAAFAVLVVPGTWRISAGVLGGAVVVLTAPGPGTLVWWAPAVLAVLLSIAAHWAALSAQRGTDAVVRSTTASVLGFYALVTSLARPELTAAVATVLALVAASTVIAVARYPRRFGQYGERVADAAFGAAAFTLPIAVATYFKLAGVPTRVILPITMATTALGVAAAAVSQVAARTPRTASAGGALAAAVGALLFSILLPTRTLVDTGVGVIIVIAAVATTATRIFEVPATADETGTTPPRRSIVDSSTVSAGLATAALIVALARLAAAAAPGIGLVTTEAMVAVTAVIVRSLPEAWRRGPGLGGVVVGGAVGLVLAGVAVIEASHAVSASTPFWSADLDRWTQRVSASTPYGLQVPVGLLLVAAAVWLLLPPPAGGDVAFVTFCLSALSLPATLGLTWVAPVVIAGGLAVIAGIGAALVAPGPPGQPPAIRRLGLAMVLGLYGVLVAGATAGSTGLMLGVFVAAGVIVASVGHIRKVADIVPGTAVAVSLAAAPGAAATTAAAYGAPASGVLGAALLVAALGVPVAFALRSQRWGGIATIGTGAAAVVIAVTAAAALPAFADAQVWAAAAALVAAAAVAAIGPPSSTVDSSRPVDRLAIGVAGVTVIPPVVIAAVASAPAWLAALAGPYRTLRDVWHGYGQAPTVSDSARAIPTLLLLTAVGAVIALRLGGGRYLLAAILPPLAACAVVTPAALNAPNGSTSWVALTVAVITGLGAALSPPVMPSAARLLRGTAGVVCAVTGGAGIAGSLATSAGTLIALAVIVVAAVTAAGLGQDPNARMVAWFVGAAAAFALPVTALAASGLQVRGGAFFVLAICGLLSAVAWQLARSPQRRAEATTVELTIALGATFALLLTLESPRDAAAVLTIWGLLLGVAALRRDRTVDLRRWLVRAALIAELFACWLLLYSVRVPLTEAYTLPFAAVALLVGALELRYNNELSSWLAYGPALVGGFGPSVVLVLIGDDRVERWVLLLVAAVLTVIVGSWRRLSAPVVTGSAVTVVVALVEMIRLLSRGQVAGGLLVAVAGGVLVGFGAISERRRRSG